MFTSLFEDKYDNLVKKDKYQILTYHVSNTYAKLAPDSILNKKIKEIMRYTGGGGGGHRTSPFTFLGQGSYQITGGSARLPLVSDVVPKPLVSEGLRKDLIRVDMTTKMLDHCP